MPATEAQIRANRQNSLKSTGPSSEAGRRRVSRNALKHGLTGQGVALPTEDRQAVEARFASMQAQLAPSNDLSEQLVRRVAFLFVRVERCERHETSLIARNVRHAAEKFDDERQTEVEALFAKLYAQPATSVRRLQMTPEGIDRLLDEWETLRDDLTHRERTRWTPNHRSHFDALMGRDAGGYRVGRIMALSEATFGGFQHLDDADGAGLDGPSRSEWARSELARLIDVEMDRLQAVRGRIDLAAIAADRAEAAERALFDPSPEMILARKYEAAAERALHKALKEFRQAEAEAAERRESDITVDTDETCDPAALNFPEPEDEAEEDDPEPAPAPKSAPPTLLALPERAMEGPNPVESAWMGPA